MICPPGAFPSSTTTDLPARAAYRAAVSPAGDPAAYLIRGAVIALRRKDAGGVRLGEGPAWD